MKKETENTKIYHWFLSFDIAVFGTKTKKSDDFPNLLAKQLSGGLSFDDAKTPKEKLDYYGAVLNKIISFPIYNHEEGADEVLFEKFKDYYYSTLSYLNILVASLDTEIERHEKKDLSQSAMNISSMYDWQLNLCSDACDSIRSDLVQYFDTL